MESVGDFFRQVRETKGLTLDDVASKTRIHPDFLKALEESNFSKLPDQVFAKGFVRSYARSLGLDEEDAMRRFDQSAGTFYDKQSETERLRLQQVEDDKRKKANRKVVVAAAAVALLGLVLLLTREQSSVAPNRHALDPEAVRPAPSALSHPREEPSVPEPVVKPADTESTTPAPAPAPPEGTAAPGDRESTLRPTERPPAPTDRTMAPAERSATSAERPTTLRSHERADTVPSVAAIPSSPSSAPEASGDLSSEPVPADGLLSGGGVPLVLDLEATDLSWVVVQVDGASPHEALLRPGERIRWKAHDRFVVTLGNAGGVRVELNGKPQGPFGQAGRVARDIVLKR